MRELHRAGLRCLSAVLFFVAGLVGAVAHAADQPVYPEADWEKRPPEMVGLSADKLKALAELVGGRGCVVRHGYLVSTWGDPAKSGDIASAVKPVISTLLLLAVQQGKIQGVDAKV